MTDHTTNTVQWLVIVVMVLFLLFTLHSVVRLQGQIVGKSPEGFHRTDAVELMEALCLMNDRLRCPDPYQLPRFERMQMEVTP